MTREHEELFDQGIAWFQEGRYKEAEKAFFQCAEAENESLAFSYLGDMYFHGIGHAANHDIARAFYEQAIKAPNPSPAAFYQLAMMTDTSTAEGKREYMYLLAEAGHRDFEPAHTALARAVMAGDILPKLPEEGIKLYEKAISLGDANAMYELADYYWRKDPSRSHIQEALDYMYKAADAGHPDALLFVGQLYANGRDDETAIKYWQEAGEKGNADAYFRLGLLCEAGRAEGIDMAECFGRSAMMGFELAEMKCREYGITVTATLHDGQKKDHRFHPYVPVKGAQTIDDPRPKAGPSIALAIKW